MKKHDMMKEHPMWYRIYCCSLLALVSLLVAACATEPDDVEKVADQITGVSAVQQGQKMKTQAQELQKKMDQRHQDAQ